MAIETVTPLQHGNPTDSIMNNVYQARALLEGALRLAHERLDSNKSDYLLRLVEGAAAELDQAVKSALSN
jgi:hypothetical protein